MRFCKDALQSKPRSQPSNAITLILAASLSILASFAFADPSAFVNQDVPDVGTFKRSDGTIVRAMEEDIGGVIGFVGFACMFELPDGRHIAVPGNAFGGGGNCIVRTLDTTAEIYTFPFTSRWFPVANRVLQFDGYRFVNVTTPVKRWFSPLIHTSHYFGGYLVAVAIFVPFLFLGAVLIRKTPPHGWWLILRAIWFISGALMIGVYGMLMMLYGPYSLVIFLFLVAVSVMLYWQSRKFIRNFRLGHSKVGG